MPYHQHCFITIKNQKSWEFFELIGASAAKIGGGTIHSSLTIKPRKKLFGLSGKFKVVFLILDELSMVSSDLWTDVDSTLGEIFMLITEKQFAGL